MHGARFLYFFLPGLPVSATFCKTRPKKVAPMPPPASSRPTPRTRSSASAGSAPFLPPTTKAKSRPAVPSSAMGVAEGSASRAPRKEAKLPQASRYVDPRHLRIPHPHPHPHPHPAPHLRICPAGCSRSDSPHCSTAGFFSITSSAPASPSTSTSAALLRLTTPGGLVYAGLRMVGFCCTACSALASLP
eukprot:scaffold116512_cov87-Phaeocystis_antarctica.AAC.4